VIVLKRHTEAIHDLTLDEAEELGRLQWAVAKLLAKETGCAKEYSVFFAEVPRFNHIHFHMVPRAHDLPTDLKGGKIFAHLKAPEGDVLPRSTVAEFCLIAKRTVERILEDHVGGSTG
jgi:diadenosine tetraphosphate (Ap4A) HIT family hydrolase